MDIWIFEYIKKNMKELPKKLRMNIRMYLWPWNLPNSFSNQYIHREIFEYSLWRWGLLVWCNYQDTYAVFYSSTFCQIWIGPVKVASGLLNNTLLLKTKFCRHMEKMWIIEFRLQSFLNLYCSLWFDETACTTP